MRWSALVAPLFLWMSACGEGTPPGPPSAVLLTLDTVRPDALGCYGGPRAVSPHLDAFARESCLYERARTTAPVTAPAHSSMLTGLYPPRHGVRENAGMALPASARTLAERAGEAGYQTAAFVAARVLNRAAGLDQGFDVYDEPARPEVVVHHYARRPAADVVGPAIGWLERRDPGRPFLMWLHFFDPHQPNDPAPEYLRQANGNPYHGEVAGMDAQIGRFLERLDELGLADRTVVVAVGDHGEAFGEHGEETHGAYCYESTVRVPLIVRYPDGSRAGERSTETVSVADVFPTLVEALGLGEPGDVDGVSLWHRRVAPERGVYVESYYGFLQYGWSPIAGWVEGGTKYLHSTSPELFDLERDPGEASAVAEGDVERFREAIAAVAGRPALASSAPAPGEERLAELAALGYATGGAGGDAALPGPLELTGRPSPREARPELGLLDRASALAQSGGDEEAIGIYREILASNPHNPTAMQELSFLLIEHGRCDEAIGVLRRRLETPPERALTHAKLGSCLESSGNVKGAIRHLTRAVELNPSHVRMIEHLIRLLQRAGRGAQARPYIERLNELQSPP